MRAPFEATIWGLRKSLYGSSACPRPPDSRTSSPRRSLCNSLVMAWVSSEAHRGRREFRTADGRWFSEPASKGSRLLRRSVRPLASRATCSCGWRSEEERPLSTESEASDHAAWNRHFAQSLGYGMAPVIRGSQFLMILSEQDPLLPVILPPTAAPGLKNIYRAAAIETSGVAFAQIDSDATWVRESSYIDLVIRFHGPRPVSVVIRWTWDDWDDFMRHGLAPRGRAIVMALPSKHAVERATAAFDRGDASVFGRQAIAFPVDCRILAEF